MSNHEEEEFYKQKYLKYKAKYLEAKQTSGGLCNENKKFLSCNPTPGCFWKDNTCQPACNNYKGDKQKCVGKPNCNWNSTSQSCYYLNPGGRA